MAAKKVIVADDEAHTLLALSLLLEKHGFGVATFEDGARLLEKVLEQAATGEQVDLLVVDVEMPEVSGLEVLETLEKIGLSLPVLAISGSEARGQLVARLRQGRVWFLEKPFSPEEFLEAVDTAVGMKEREYGTRRAVGGLCAPVQCQVDDADE